MSKWIDRILGLQDEDNFEKEFEMDFEEEYKNQYRKDQELKEKVFGYEALTYEEFIKLMQISVNKFRQSFGAYDRDLEVVFREKTKQTVKKKKESEKTNNEK